MNRIFAYGLRNSFGLAFDPESGSLWQTENGPEDYDEINRIFPGWNGGWMRIKGPVAADAEGESDLWIAPGATYGDPQLSFLGTTAPAGLEFVGSRILGCELEHDLIMGDTNCRQLYRFKLDAARENLVFTSPALLDRVVDNATDKCTHSELNEILWGPGPNFGPRIPDVKNGPDGYLYFSSWSQGQIKRQCTHDW